MAQGRAMPLEQVLSAHQEGTLDCGTYHLVNTSAQQGNSPYSRYTSSYCSYKNPLSGRSLVVVALLHKSRAVSDRRLAAPYKRSCRGYQRSHAAEVLPRQVILTLPFHPI